MDIRIIENTIPVAELQEIAKEFYSPMLKGAVDVEKEIVAFGGEYHMDANNLLIEQGSEQKNIWGFNIYVDNPRDSWIEYTALINIRPVNKNPDMEIEDADLRARMKEIIESKII
ncbi:MAG: DUF5674 family protein [bacterium]|nr:DUF5674 family protein [bacterium]